MGNNDLSNNENILIKVDHNNLIYIDPNSVVNDGQIEPRGIKQENLMMYVNLEADLVPRTTLISNNDTGTLFSVAKGTINLLRNQKGGDYDTTWTEAFLDRTDINKNTTSSGVNEINLDSGVFTNADGTAQSFGIDSINITTKGFNAIPQVTINFIDVRGKTLFESPENSPYKAFFHLPWPVFYLTIKGYYGKAIRYRLHMVKFNTKFNESNGNFEIVTNFVGSTFAYLNDIPINGILNAPYMYMIESEGTNKTLNNGVFEQKLKKSSKGYAILKSIYDEYKQKGLIDKDFPVKTLRELIVVAESLDKILEKEIFDQVVDMKVFAGIKDFENKIEEFENAVIAWGNRYLSAQTLPNRETNYNGTTYGYFYLSSQNKTDTSNITGKTGVGTLENILTGYVADLDEIQKVINSNKNITKGNFTKLKSNNKIKNINDYVVIDQDKKVGVAIELIVKNIREIITEFIKQRDTLQREVEEKMNTVVKDPKKGIGFDPTIRNIFAVILANADVFIRLMKDVHVRAFDVANERKKILSTFSDETPGGTGAVYPWPEVKKSVGGGLKHKAIAYPGDSELSEKLQTNDEKMWPEVDFVENYQGIATKKFDSLSDNEGGIGKINYIFESNQPENKLKKISTLNTITYGNPYVNKTVVSILYELFERSYYSTLFDSFDSKTIKELANIEFDNLKQSINEDFDIVDMLKSQINSVSDLYIKMIGLSPFEKYPYLKDQLPTTPYISDVLNVPFKIEQYNGVTDVNNDSDYVSLSDNIKNYTPRSYRKNIYPFNSDLYLSYINKTSFKDDEFKFKGNLKVDTQNGFITSPINPKAWVKNGYRNNLLGNKLTVSGTTINILNTPYFHKQLYSDFSNAGEQGKYVGSAYLLLNSLPFNDLEDVLDFGEGNPTIRMSSLFREVGSTHFLPYHLILKWGSIYHRYKKHILDSEEILSGFLTSGLTTTINGSVFFDNNSGTTFTTNLGSVTYSGHTDVGIHPFYDAIFHQIVNGYATYDVLSGNTSFSGMTAANGILTHNVNVNGTKYWTNLVDNSKYDGEMKYTVLPSDGFNQNPPSDNFYIKEQREFRTIWSNEDNNISFSGLTFAAYNEYNRSYESGSTENDYAISNDYRKVIDLIATFSPDILDEFESLFLTFASGKIEEELPYQKFNKVHYYQFQDLLGDIFTVTKLSGDTTNLESLIGTVKTRQGNKLIDVTSKILSNDNLLKFTIANPKEIDAYVIGGFADIYTGNSFSYGQFNVSQITANQKFIELYVGEDISGGYLQFFATNDIQLNEENVLLFRPLILIFASLYEDNPSITKSDFQQYLADNVLVLTQTNLTSEHSLFLETLIANFSKNLTASKAKKITPVNGYNDDPLKLEMYSFFKSFNDKWIGGNSIGQRLLFEEFLFLDKANKDIGSQAYFNLEKLIPLGDVKNQKSTLYGVISMLIQGTGFDMRALPSYVNFYGTNYSNKTKLTPSKNVAKNIFGTFLEVDYQESSPKVIIQYTGPTSKHLDIAKYSKDYKFNDDSFNLGNINNNPLVVTAPEVFNNGDLYKSNRVVAFEISFGDQYQSIFKGVQLDQSTIKNTTESFIAQENLARSESGANAYQVDIGLFDIYRQSSYSCVVTCMGNVMIQPTMYFYLKNIPMFKGSYWITDVSHSIKGNVISTSFTGTRIPYASLPDPKDSMMATYKPLFDTITNRAIIRINESSKQPTLEKSLSISGGTSVSIVLPSGFTIDNIVKGSGVTPFGVPYNGGGINGEKYIQKIKYNGGEWLQAVAVQMGGQNYTPTNQMSIFSYISNPPTQPLYFTDINDNRGLKFYCTRFQLDTGIPDKLIQSTTDFVNPANGLTETIVANNSLATSPKTVAGPVHVGPSSTTYGIGLSKSLMSSLKLYDGDVVYFRLR
jgi:hypothetical protein